MTLRVSADPKAVEATDPDVLNNIGERAKAMGATQHHFYGTDTEVLVVDEWPDEETFQKFFESSPEVKELMDRAGAGQPDITFWHHLDVDDDIG
jgi:heme-degrading monooxygenase HmoA